MISAAVVRLFAQKHGLRGFTDHTLTSPESIFIYLFTPMVLFHVSTGSNFWLESLSHQYIDDARDVFLLVKGLIVSYWNL